MASKTTKPTPRGTIDEAFGITLRALRLQRGLSQEALAFDSGMHRTFISQMERGLKAPSLTTVFKLAEALDVSPTVMVEGVRTRLRGMN